MLFSSSPTLKIDLFDGEKVEQMESIEFYKIVQ